MADYNAGRRYGNSNGQAGAFGASTGFGGFGQTTGAATGGFGATSNTGGGLFGSNNQTQNQSPFGQNQTSTTSGFGGGGLFGSQPAKPATTGLFGSTPAASSGTQSGGLFGTSGTTTGGFGSGGFGANTNNTSTTGGLFGGNNQNQTQNKPAFGGFGASTTGTGGFGSSTSGGFGQQPAATGGGGLFGSSTTNNNNPFGGSTQQPQSGGSNLFGGFGQNNNNNNQTQTGTSSFGGFGQNQNQTQQKPSLFGGSTSGTGTSLFGGNNNNNNQQTQQPSGGLFGNTQNNQQSGGLFGAKPAATGGTGLFGNTQSNAGNTGTSLFGSTQQNQNQGSSLFGGIQQQPQKTSLFGGSTNNNTGGSLFGGLGQNNNNQNSFGASQQQQNQGSSLFGNSQQNMQQSQQQQPLTASLLQNPYGNDQLFANLGTPAASVGPLATPLSGAQKPAKRPQMLPAFKINPSASMRLITPQKRANGYGFAYSSYGTPGSAQSFSSGRNSLLGSGSLGRPLSKSLSTSNLRSSLSAEDSVLAPGAFTPNHRPYSSGSSIRKLKIDRSLRTDLFGTADNAEAGRPNKRVSFDAAGANGIGSSQTNGDSGNGASNALVRTETDGPEPSSEELGLLRAPRPAPKESRPNGTTPRPEMEQAKGNELAIVPEDEQVPATEPRTNARKGLRKSQTDQEPGEYYMSPSMQELRDMSREQLKKVSPFTVGRVGIGKIEFSEVNLNTVPLDDVMGQIVKLNIRSATVYETGVNTPPEGKGLNVPSTITLENSWPRSNAGRLPVHERKGPRYDKHIERLKRVGGTEFISYDPESGEWVFRVQHFTTYELDDEDETMLETSGTTAQADTPTPKVAQSSEISRVSEEDASMMSPENSDPDDTFDFKKSAKKSIPGGFSDRPVYEDADMEDRVQHEDEVSDDGHGTTTHMDDPFDEANDTQNSQALMSPPETDNETDQEMLGSFPASAHDDNIFGASMMPKSILKSTAPSGTPVRKSFDFEGDWAEQLQRTVSPKKQDRQALRERQPALSNDAGGMGTTSLLKTSVAGGAFNTTMDIMNSLWAQPKNASVRAPVAATGGKGFEV